MAAFFSIVSNSFESTDKSFSDGALLFHGGLYRILIAFDYLTSAMTEDGPEVINEANRRAMKKKLPQQQQKQRGGREREREITRRR